MQLASLVRRLIAFMILALGVAAPLQAAEVANAQQTRVPKPVIEQGKGDRCVEDTDYMRKNHMKLLMHQRDETMHKGVRTVKHSLKNCIECHASQKTNTVAGSNENFCQSCHAYTAVKIDCFECHATKPKQTAFHPLTRGNAKADPHGNHALAAKLRMQTGATLAAGQTKVIK